MNIKHTIGKSTNHIYEKTAVTRRSYAIISKAMGRKFEFPERILTPLAVGTLAIDLKR
jgi:hypothetical protein